MERTALKTFYNRLFPFELIAKWVSYGTREYLERREFACELSVGTSADETAFKRHLSFATGEEMRREFLSLVPNRIEIGPVYSHPPKQRDNFSTFAAQERELIFDIDMDSYDEIRLCCKGAAVCMNCWPLATTALKVIAHTLEDCFGFKHLLWVFSGRRGIHLWVGDARARKLSNEAREAIINFLTVIQGSGKGDDLSQRVSGLKFPLHPSLQYSFDNILLPFFENHYMATQRVLEDEVSENSLLLFLPEGDLRNELRSIWKEMRMGDPIAKWKTLKSFCEKKRGKQGLFNTDPVASIVFAHTYPRLDANVTKVLNHLLKSPFCVHPSTGKISVPIDPDKCDEFDPDKVPTMNDLLKDIDEFDRNAMVVDENEKPQSGVSDLHKTRLAQSVSVLERFINGLSS